MQLKTQKPQCPPKPPDLAQRVKSMLAETYDEQEEFTPGQNTDVTQSESFLPSQDEPSPTDKTPDNSKASLNGSVDDLDIPYIDEDEALS